MGGVGKHNSRIERHQKIGIIDCVARSGARSLTTAPPVIGCIHLAISIVEPGTRGCGVVHNPAEVDVEDLRATGIHMEPASVAGGRISVDRTVVAMCGFGGHGSDVYSGTQGKPAGLGRLYRTFSCKADEDRSPELVFDSYFRWEGSELWCHNIPSKALAWWLRLPRTVESILGRL